MIRETWVKIILNEEWERKKKKKMNKKQRFDNISRQLVSSMNM